MNSLRAIWLLVIAGSASAVVASEGATDVNEKTIRALFESGKHEKAVPAIRRMLENEPDRWFGLAALHGIARKMPDRYEEELFRSLETAISRAKTPDRHVELLWEQLSRAVYYGRSALVHRLLHDPLLALATDPSPLKQRHLQIWALMAAVGDADEVAMAERRLKAIPFGAAIYHRARLRQEKGDLGGARQLLDVLISIPTTESIRALREIGLAAQSLNSKQELEAADALFERLWARSQELEPEVIAEALLLKLRIAKATGDLESVQSYGHELADAPEWQYPSVVARATRLVGPLSKFMQPRKGRSR